MFGGYPPTAIGYPPTAIGYPPTAIGYPPAAIVGRIGHSELFFFPITAPPAPGPELPLDDRKSFRFRSGTREAFAVRPRGARALRARCAMAPSRPGCRP